MNTQKVFPVLRELPATEDVNYFINEIFYSMQGEGPFAGLPAIFIRMAGCNLQCPKCDTQYLSYYTCNMTAVLKAVACMMQAYYTSSPIVVITGGEPFRQPIELLIKQLIDKGYCVQVETNGTIKPRSVNLLKGCNIVCSPKTNYVAPEFYNSLHTNFKYVISSQSVIVNGLPIEALGNKIKKPLFNCMVKVPNCEAKTVYIQPLDEQNAYLNGLNLKAATRLCLKHGYRFSFQLHKLGGLR